jgi:hypothetical protein
MGRRRFVGWSGVVAGLGLAVASVAPVPSSAAPRSIWSGAGAVPAPLGPDDLPQLWGAARPADLVEVTPSGSPVTDEYLDMAAGLWVDPNEVPGPPDADGCGALTLLATTAVIPWFDPLGTASGNAPATYDSARLCAGPDGAGTILELTGHTDHGGPLRTYFARPAVDRSWHSTAVEYGPQHCYVYAPVGGFPAPAGDADYRLQAWNLGDDPAVDCSDRTAPPPTTSTTTPTTTAVGQVPDAPPADAVAGRAPYTG